MCYVFQVKHNLWLTPFVCRMDLLIIGPSYSIGFATCLWFYFDLQSFLVWRSPTCQFLLLLSLLLVSKTKNPRQDQCQVANLVCVLLRVAWFQVLHSNLYFELILCMMQDRGPVFPAQFIEETVSSPLYIFLQLCCKLTIYAQVYL